MIDILSIFTSGGFGAIIGLAGSWLTKREERKNLELQYKHELNMADKRQEEAKTEYSHELIMADKQIERAQVEGQITQDVKAMDAFIESQETNGNFKIVETIRTLTRVFIVTYLLIMTTFFTAYIGKIIGGITSMPVNELVGIYKNILIEMVFLTNVAVSWWYGSRPAQVKK